MIFRFKAKMSDVGIPVWRTFELDGHATFYELHKVMQQLFNWTDSHLYGFFVHKSNGAVVKRITIGPKSPDEPNSTSFQKYQDQEEELSNWFIKNGDKVLYIYDFGDNWEHEIELVKQYHKNPNAISSLPKCLDAMNNTPPEDSRFGIIEGTVDLSNPNPRQIVDEINEVIDASKKTHEKTNKVTDNWPETLQLTKRFFDEKPWQKMDDEHIFAVYSKETRQTLFCSVIGKHDEIYGLAVYIGMDGFFALMDTLTNEESSFDAIQRQHSILLTFEDRNDLEKEEYELIKRYDISFRGKKAWPSFVSFKPGFYPWGLDNREAAIVSNAIIHTLDIYDEIKAGLKLPFIPKDEKVLIRIPKEKNGVVNYENKLINIDEVLFSETESDFTLSEIEIKRLSKIKRPLSMTVEFTLTALNIPVQQSEGERPLFPISIIAVNQDDGEVIYQKLVQEEITAAIAQTALMEVITELKGFPNLIITDPRTYRFTGAVIDYADISVEISDELPIINELLKDLYAHISDK